MASAMKTSEVITLSECESSEEEEKDLRGAASQPNALTDAVHSAMASAARVISPPLHESARAAASQTPSSGGQQDKKKKGKAARGKGRGRAKKSVAEDSCDDDADFEFEPRRENPARSGRGRGSVRRAASTTKTSKNSVEEYGADEGDNAEDDDDGDEKAVVVKGRKRRLKQSAASSDEEVGLASESDGRQRSAKSSTSRRTSTSSARRTPRATDAEADTPVSTRPVTLFSRTMSYLPRQHSPPPADVFYAYCTLSSPDYLCTSRSSCILVSFSCLLFNLHVALLPLTTFVLFAVGMSWSLALACLTCMPLIDSPLLSIL